MGIKLTFTDDATEWAFYQIQKYAEAELAVRIDLGRMHSSSLGITVERRYEGRILALTEDQVDKWMFAFQCVDYDAEDGPRDVGEPFVVSLSCDSPYYCEDVEVKLL